MVIFPLAPDQTIAQMWSNGARGGSLWAGKPSRYVASYLGQLSLLSLQGRQIEYQPYWLWLRRGRSPVSFGR